MIRRILDEGIALIGSSTSPVTLTGSYSAANSGKANIADGEHVTLYIAYTMGTDETANSIEVKIEFSDDASTWYRRTNEARSDGTTTLTVEEYTFTATVSAGTYDYIRIPLTDLADKHLKVSVKETGIASNGGSCYVVLNYNKP